MTRPAAGTAGVNGVHQRQRTVDASSGLSQDLSSLDEDDNQVQQLEVSPDSKRATIRSWRDCAKS